MDRFENIFLIDFEFGKDQDNLPEIRCLVVKEVHKQETTRFWIDDLVKLEQAPFSIGKGSLVVSYYSIAEMTCFLKLRWELPKNNLDLFTEFRKLTNSTNNSSDYGSSLLAALNYFNIQSIESIEKDINRNLALRGGEYTESEKVQLLNYCNSDVLSLEALLQAMKEYIELDYALFRGEYMKTCAVMEFNGVPVDQELLTSLDSNWEKIESKLIEDFNSKYNLFEKKSFKYSRFEKFLQDNNIKWPLLESGKLDLKDDTFRYMSQLYPIVAPIKEIKHTLSKLKLRSLVVGADGRNRTMLSPFRSTTSRNQPSNSKFIFGPSTWVRGLIQPKRGMGIAYIDWSQQEFGIASALSKDPNMIKAYLSGDPYLEFAKQAGAVPLHATKEIYKNERDLYKQCVLAVQYGMGSDSLAKKIGQQPAYAENLLGNHKKIYSKFWEWSDRVVDFALCYGYLETVFGWRVKVGGHFNERSLRNFPMQANGAEILRLACVYLVNHQIKVCAPVHDAILIEAPVEKMNEVVEKSQKLMEKASSDILGGFKLRSDVKIFNFPDRYMDDRGIEMWGKVNALLATLNDSNSTFKSPELNIG